MEKEFTAIYLIDYYHTTGVIERTSKNRNLVGYCIESPQKVLDVAFKDYHITKYNSLELFSSGDFEPTTPMVGLEISRFNPVFGINGRIKSLLQLEELIITELVYGCG